MSEEKTLYDEWLQAKEDERRAVEHRRSVENELISELKVPENMEGTQTHDVGPYRVKVTGRMNRRIDADKLQEISHENGLFEHLSDLFRWKPEINARAWKAADESITRPLQDAITTTPGRPSFSIETKEDK